MGGEGGGHRAGLSGRPAGCLPPEEVDMLLQRCEGGVDAALLYAKNMAKYMKDLIGYLEKRTMLGKSGPGCGAGGRRRPHSPALTPPPPAEMDFAKGLQKIVHSCRQSVMQEVGSLGPGCASPRPPEGPQGRGPPPAPRVPAAADGPGKGGRPGPPP